MSTAQQDDDGEPGSHGVHGTTRDDGKMQEEPEDGDGSASDAAAWADKTEKGGDAA